MLNPGLVGLSVLDAFALGLPMVTCDLPYHSPEIEYLVDGENGLVLAADTSAAEYGDNVAALMNDSDRLNRLSAGALASAEQYTVEEMVDRFATGILTALAGGEVSPRRRSLAVRGVLFDRWNGAQRVAGATCGMLVTEYGRSSRGCAEPSKMVSERSLTHRTATGLAWSWGSIAVTAGMQLVYTAVMSRLLEPADFGLVAAALLGLRFVTYFSRFGLASAVVQRPTLDQRDISTAMRLSIVLGVGAGGLAIALSPVLAAIIREPGAAAVMRWLALSVMIGTIAGVPEALVRRSMRFRDLGAAQVLSYAVGYLGVGIVAAVRGWGVWSLVAATIAQAVCMLVLTWVIGRPTLRAGFSRVAARQMLSFGGTVAVTGFLEFLTGSIDTLAVGRYVGTAGLGQYSRATLLVTLPVEQATTATTQSAAAKSEQGPDRVGAVRQSGPGHDRTARLRGRDPGRDDLGCCAIARADTPRPGLGLGGLGAPNRWCCVRNRLSHPCACHCRRGAGSHPAEVDYPDWNSRDYLDADRDRREYGADAHTVRQCVVGGRGGTLHVLLDLDVPHARD